jgi:menaquinone-dependent protoporphyrinogen oxidase
MKLLVAYASRHGSTGEIAHHIAARLGTVALDLPEHRDQPDLLAYDAFVVGSAAYMGRWLPEATDFVRDHALLLRAHPTWLFSSGPLRVESFDPERRDLLEAAVPEEIAGFRDTIEPLDHRVFFGALDPSRLGVRDRMIRMLPAGRKLLPEGDFRDWRDIDEWIDGIAAALVAAPAG